MTKLEKKQKQNKNKKTGNTEETWLVTLKKNNDKPVFVSVINIALSCSECSQKKKK